MARVQAIVGPTATGKSELADAVAAMLGCSVISVDSMQIYRGMDIGTAKVMPAERHVPLEMVDVADPTENYSAERFQAAARVCVDSSLARSGYAVLCGGTGLYLDAVIDELDFAQGEKGSTQRSAYEEQAQQAGAEALWEELLERDPAAAALIHPNNTRRVIRALEMADTGQSYATRAGGIHTHTPHYEADIWCLTCARDELYRRIDTRVDAMFEAGLVDEVRQLADSGLTSTTTAGQAIGYKEILDASAGTCTLEEARATIKQRSRRYAKRQLSWFRRDGRLKWIDRDTTSLEEATARIVAAARTHTDDAASTEERRA